MRCALLRSMIGSRARARLCFRATSPGDARLERAGATLVHDEVFRMPWPYAEKSGWATIPCRCQWHARALLLQVAQHVAPVNYCGSERFGPSCIPLVREDGGAHGNCESAAFARERSNGALESPRGVVTRGLASRELPRLAPARPTSPASVRHNCERKCFIALSAHVFHRAV